MIHHIDKEDALIEQNTNYRAHRMISEQRKTLATKFYNNILNHLAKVEGNFFEIGTFNGYGAARIAERFPDKKIYVVDPFIEDGHTGYTVNSALTSQRRNALNNLKDHDNVVLFEMRSDIFKEKWIEEVENIIVVFIDGSHHYDDVKNDLEVASQILNIGGQIFVDDYQIPDVRKACLEFLDSYDNYDRVEDGVYRRLK